MKESHYITEEELVNKAVAALLEKLGPVEASRFLALPAEKRTESVKRHHLWQSQLDKDKFFDAVFRSKSGEAGDEG